MPTWRIPLRAAAARRSAPAALGVLALAALAMGLTGGFAAAAPGGSATTISTAPGPFGPDLVVGAGPYAGQALYTISSDQPPSFGCTAKVVALPGGPRSCTGPSNDRHAEWPALTSVGRPLAGAGVQGRLLGLVPRPGIGVQVTYGGHPLYLFDGTQLGGEGWFEPSLPPDHGIWWALSPAGTPLAWSGTLASMVAKGRHVLAYEVFDAGGWQLVPVYAFSGDHGGASACTGACAVRWPPLLTSGTPGVEGLAQAGAVGSLRRADGTVQVTYAGRPLYLYSDEAIVKDPHDSAYHATGSGNEMPGPGGRGRFYLVLP